MKLNRFVFLGFFFLSLNVEARLFSNSYVSFELPPNWNCKQEGFEHVCTNDFSKKRKKAIIILTAKKRGPQDSLGAYEAHLKAPRQQKNFKSQAYLSTVKSVRKRKIAGIDWIDGTHLGSEVQTYYTRYAATVKDNLGILVSFSAHKDHYSTYSSDFVKAIKSLKVIAPKELSQFGGSGKYRNKRSDLFGEASLSDSFPDGMYGDLTDEAEGSNSQNLVGGVFSALGTKGLIGVLLLLITGLGAFIYHKAR